MKYRNIERRLLKIEHAFWVLQKRVLKVGICHTLLYYNIELVQLYICCYTFLKAHARMDVRLCVYIFTSTLTKRAKTGSVWMHVGHQPFLEELEYLDIKLTWNIELIYEIWFPRRGFCSIMNLLNVFKFDVWGILTQDFVVLCNRKVIM